METAEFERPINDTVGQRIFPLHLIPFEHYMLIDDRPNYPATFIVQFEFAGSLERKPFKDSIDDAIDRHPLLRAVIRRAKSNRDCWVDSGNVRPMVHFGGVDEPIAFPGAGFEHIDLCNEAGLRIWVRHNERKAVVTAQFHHAVCDGVGAYQVLGDVLWGYATRTGGDEIESAPPLPPSRLRARGRACYDPAEFRTDQGRFQSEWKFAAELLFRRTAAIRPPTSKRTHTTLPGSFPGICSFEFDKNEHRRLRLSAQQRAQTVNDLLLETLFVTLNRWRKRNRGWLSGGKLCVMMPLDLREPEAEKMPACNVVSYALIRRGGKLLEQPDKLRQGLREETVWLKHQRHRTHFMNLVVASQSYPRLLKAALRRNHCLATAVLSNTGDPTKQFLINLPRENGMVRCGNLLLTDISGVPPMRINTRATISIFTYRRVLKICLRCDPRLFNFEETNQLLGHYVDQITSALD